MFRGVFILALMVNPLCAQAGCFEQFLNPDHLIVEFTKPSSKMYDYEVSVYSSLLYKDHKSDIYELGSIQLSQVSPKLNAKLSLAKSSNELGVARFWISKEQIENVEVTAHYLYQKQDGSKCLGTAAEGNLKYYFNKPSRGKS